MSIFRRLALVSFAALSVLGAAQASFGQSAADLERQAEERFAEDDLDAAIALYRRLADQLPDAAEKSRVLITMAYVQHLAGHNADAASAVSEVLVADPDYAFRPELYPKAFQALFYDGQKQAAEARDQLGREALRRGLDHLKRRDYPAARQDLETALETLPEHAGALYNLALIHLYEGREEAARAGFERVLSLPAEKAPRATRVLSWVNLGHLLIRGGLYSDAETALARAVELDPEHAAAWSNLGVARRRLGQKGPAAEAFRRAYELEPDDPEIMNHLALAYLDAGDWTSAAALLERVTGEHDSSASMWLYLGRAQLGLGRAGDAVRSLRAAIARDPQNSQGSAAEAALQLARHYYAAGDARSTLEEADRTLAWRPGSATAHVYRGLAEKALGDLAAARASLEEARRLEPTRAETHNNLGSVYFELDLFDEAEAAFRRALEIDPGSPGIRQNLEAVRIARGLPRADNR